MHYLLIITNLLYLSQLSSLHTNSLILVIDVRLTLAYAIKPDVLTHTYIDLHTELLIDYKLRHALLLYQEYLHTVLPGTFTLIVSVAANPYFLRANTLSHSNKSVMYSCILTPSLTQVIPVSDWKKNRIEQKC